MISFIGAPIPLSEPHKQPHTGICCVFCRFMVEIYITDHTHLMQGATLMAYKILLVEDNPHIMEINAETLRMENYDVVGAPDGKTCI